MKHIVARRRAVCREIYTYSSRENICALIIEKFMVWVLIQLFIGSIALFVALIRTMFNHFTCEHHVGMESGIWYWHFVDGVGICYVIYHFKKMNKCFLFFLA